MTRSHKRSRSHTAWFDRELECLVEVGIRDCIKLVHNQPAEPIGNIPPAEAEARYYAMINEQKLTA